MRIKRFKVNCLILTLGSIRKDRGKARLSAAFLMEIKKFIFSVQFCQNCGIVLSAGDNSGQKAKT